QAAKPAARTDAVNRESTPTPDKVLPARPQSELRPQERHDRTTEHRDRPAPQPPGRTDHVEAPRGARVQEQTHEGVRDDRTTPAQPGSGPDRGSQPAVERPRENRTQTAALGNDEGRQTPDLDGRAGAAHAGSEQGQV